MKKITIFVVILFLATGVLAQTTDLFLLALNARALGLGRTSVANIYDSNSTFSNPAALGLIKNPEISTLYNNDQAFDSDYFFVSGAMPLNVGYNFGLGMLSAGVYRLSVTTREPDTGRIISGATFNYFNQLYTLSCGKSFGSKVSFGAGINFFREGYSGTSMGDAQGNSLNLGLLLQLNPHFSIGALAQNIISTGLKWTSGHTTELPRVNKLGLAYFPWEGLTLSADAFWQAEYPTLLHFGFEWWPIKKFIQFRSGLDQKPRTQSSVFTNYTIGVGLSFFGLSFDYAYYIDQEIAENSVHYFSIALGERFPKPVVEEKIEVKPVSSEAIATKEVVVSPEAIPIRKEESLRERAQPRITALKTKLGKINAYLKELNDKLYLANKKKDKKLATKLKDLIEGTRKRKSEIESQIRKLESL